MVVSKAILDGMSKELLLGREIRAGRIGAAALVAPRIKGIEHGVVGEPQLGLPVEADPPRPLAPFLLDRRIFGISGRRSEEHTSELQSLMRISYAVFCLKKKNLYSHSTSHTVDVDF